MNKSVTNVILSFLTGATAGVVVGMLIHREKRPAAMDKISQAAGLIADAVKMQLAEEVKELEPAELKN